MALIKAPMLALLVILFAAVVTKQSAVSASRECCKGYTQGRIPFTAIKGYSVQNELELCSIRAIIFYTEQGKACTNPALKWVINYVIRLGREAQTIHKTLRNRKSH